MEMKIKSRLASVFVVMLIAFAIALVIPFNVETVYASEGDSSMTRGTDILKQNVQFPGRHTG